MKCGQTLFILPCDKGELHSFHAKKGGYIVSAIPKGDCIHFATPIQRGAFIFPFEMGEMHSFRHPKHGDPFNLLGFAGVMLIFFHPQSGANCNLKRRLHAFCHSHRGECIHFDPHMRGSIP